MRVKQVEAAAVDEAAEAGIEAAVAVVVAAAATAAAIAEIEVEAAVSVTTWAGSPSALLLLSLKRTTDRQSGKTLCSRQSQAPIHFSWI